MKANTNTNNNSDKRHHKSYIHPRTSLPLLAVGCFALMSGHAAIAAISVNWDGGAGTANLGRQLAAGCLDAAVRRGSRQPLATLTMHLYR